MLFHCTRKLAVKLPTSIKGSYLMPQRAMLERVAQL